jgi:hypothetical protein
MGRMTACVRSRDDFCGHCGRCFTSGSPPNGDARVLGTDARAVLEFEVGREHSDSVRRIGLFVRRANYTPADATTLANQFAHSVSWLFEFALEKCGNWTISISWSLNAPLVADH